MTLPKMNRDELLDLIPAYALNALDEEDRLAVEALLDTDTDAQAMLQDYHAIADTIAYHVPVRPAPSHLRGDLAQKLAARRGISVVGRDDTPDKKTPEESPPNTPTLFSRLTIGLVASAAAIVILVIGFAVVTLDTTDTANPAEELYNQLLAQSNSEKFEISPDGAPDSHGQLVVAANHEAAVLRVASLPDIEDNQSYQLWLISEDGVRSGGIFHWPDGHGPYYIEIVPDAIGDLAAAGMTIEPFDGSPLGNAPTGDRLFAVSVASAN